jgi:hypothetical protein
LLVDDGLAEGRRPVEILVHHVQDDGIVQQRQHAGVPIGAGLGIRCRLLFLEETRGLHDIKRIGGRGQGNGQHFVRIEGDRRNQRLDFLRGKQRNFLLRGLLLGSSLFLRPRYAGPSQCQHDQAEPQRFEHRRLAVFSGVGPCYAYQWHAARIAR